MRVKLRELRKEKGISQSFLAKKLGFKYPSGYASIEMGRNRLSIEQAKVIADCLGVSVEELVEDDKGGDNSEDFFKKKLPITGRSNVSA